MADPISIKNSDSRLKLILIQLDSFWLNCNVYMVTLYELKKGAILAQETN